MVASYIIPHGFIHAFCSQADRMNKNDRTNQELIEENFSLKQKIKELEQSGSTCKALFAGAAEGILAADLQTKKFVYANPALCKMFGYTEEEILRLGVEDIHPKNSLEQVIAEFNAMERGEKMWALKIPCLRRDGSIFYANISNAAVVLDSVKCNLGFFTDITELMKAEDELRESESKCRFLSDKMSDIAWIADMNLHTTYITPSIQKVLGFTPEERVHQTLHQQLTPDSMTRAVDMMTRELALEEHGTADPTRVLNIQLEYYHKNGSTRWLDVVVTGIRNDQGVLTAIHGVSRDITVRKQAEEALRESERRYREFFATSRDCVFITSKEGKWINFNDAALELFGYDNREELFQAPISSLYVDPEERTRFLAQIEDQGYIRENPVQLRRKDGVVINTLITAGVRQSEDSSKIEYYGTIRDITQSKRVEEEKRKSEENFRRSLDESPLGARIVSIKGETLYANRALLDIYGYETIAELRETPTKLRYTPESYAEFLDRREKRRMGQPLPSEYEISIFRKNGEIRRLQAFRKEILWNGTSQFQILYNDITERKRAEEEKQKLQDRLNRAEKMEVLGQLAGKVAHDLNNVLGVLTGYSELLLMDIPEDHRARANVEKIMQSTEKGAAIIQDLLTLARRGVTATEVVNLNHVVSGFIKSPVFDKLKEQHYQVTFRSECDDNLLNIKGSPVHLEKALMNLVFNAAEAIAGAGEVTIRTENRYLDKSVRGYDEIREGDYVVLTVSDTGTGISADHKEKIFEPFYTSKKMGKSGTGLGLPIVWGMVKDHKGYIDVQSRVGEGTILSIYFPVTREETVTARQKEKTERYRGRGESVLVVDDIAEQRDVASALLEKLGYRVHAVSSGEKAVEYLKGNKADILILDMIMAPGIDGLETYRRVLEIHPKQKAVIMSGFSETDRVREAQKLGAGPYIKKPYVLETIGVAIRDELARS
jgi:PAS domain S-box-containing protein